MRLPILLLPLLAATATAAGPESKDFRRMSDLKDRIASRLAQLKAQAEFDAKPREEKILILFDRGEKKYDKATLTGKFVVETTLVKWAEVQQEVPSPAGTRVLESLPDVLARRYTASVEIDKRDRWEASKELLEAMDSDFVHVRVAAVDALRKIYRTANGYGFKPDMDKRERRSIIKQWERHIDKERRR